MPESGRIRVHLTNILVLNSTGCAATESDFPPKSTAISLVWWPIDYQMHRPSAIKPRPLADDSGLFHLNYHRSGFSFYIPSRPQFRAIVNVTMICSRRQKYCTLYSVLR